ncbi:hypothetical protein B484DRAFT_450583, partial [Ochromonadaceae sp. CCMP2298]
AKVGAVDVTTPPGAAIAARYKIGAFPTLLVFKDGQQVAEYQGARGTRDLTEYLKMKAGPVVRVLGSVTELLYYLTQFENGDLQERGLFSIVVGAFVPREDVGGVGSDTLGVDAGAGAGGGFGSVGAGAGGGGGSGSGRGGLSDVDVGTDGTNSDTDTVLAAEGTEAGGAVFSHAERVFHDTARNFELALFLTTSDPEVLSYLEMKEESVVVFQEFPDDIRRTFPLNPSTTPLDFMSYLLAESLPTTVAYSAETGSILSSLPCKSHVLMFTHTTSNRDSFVELVETVAASQRFDFSHYLYSHLPPPRTRSSTLYRQATGQGTNTIQVSGTWESESGTEEPGHFLRYSAEQVEGFLTSYLGGGLSPSLMSETEAEVRKLNNAGRAVEVTGAETGESGGNWAGAGAGGGAAAGNLRGPFFLENISGSQFAEKVLLKPLPSFLYFHAPWCGHCKSLEPVLAVVAGHYTRGSMEQKGQGGMGGMGGMGTEAEDGVGDSGNLGNDGNYKNAGKVGAGVTLYRIDGTKNEILHPGVRIIGYPTMYLFPLSGGAIEYDGERTADAIIGFIDSFSDQ